MERKSGILLPISALPGRFGIGTFGRDAYAFADFLHDAGMRYWQMLPLSPVDFAHSPYASPSAFAGEPSYIDPELLAEDGLLTREELCALLTDADPQRVSYDALRKNRPAMLKSAYRRGYERDRDAVELFVRENERWLPDYALFMALREHFGGKPWTEWEEPIRRREPSALAFYRETLAEELRFFIYTQFLFFRQWNALRDYIHSLGLRIIGDLPIYVSLDSADVWAEPRCFQLAEDGTPKALAGVPPDYFCEDGQLWGNPLYDYDYMARDGYGWWIRRVEGVQRLCDVIRIDHFRGFESYWSVPYDEKTAKNGHWEKGPGMKLVGVLRDWFWQTPFIAEDLGILTEEVRTMREASGFPGMKVLEFAFDPHTLSDYLPHGYEPNCVCYVGTHDNEPVQAWRHHIPKEELAFATRYLGLNEQEGIHWGMIRGGMSSAASLFVATMQDCLGLGAEARMNTPGTCGGDNWTWRMAQGAADAALAKRLREMNRMYGRL